jgi:amino acid adenylation domain-containing protein
VNPIGAVVLRVSRPRPPDELLGGLRGSAATAWTEMVPHPADDPRAEGLRRRIAGHPIAADRGRAVRVTLLSYSDGAQELVLAADSRCVGEGGLYRLAIALATGADPEPIPAPGPQPPAPGVSAVDWVIGPVTGPPRRETAAVTGPRTADPQRMLTAIADAMALRCGTAVTVVLRQPSPADAPTAPDLRTSVRFGVDGSQHVEPAIAELCAPPDDNHDRHLAAAGLWRVTRICAPADTLLLFTLDAGLLSCSYRADVLCRVTVDVLLNEISAWPAPVPPPGRAGPSAVVEPRTIDAMVADQAARWPSRVAVRATDGDLSYRQLDAWSTVVADALRARGVGVGQTVGVCLPRSKELIVALLGVLKSGAAYVPLDPANPAERLRYLIEDAAPATVVTDDPARAGLGPRAMPMPSAQTAVEKNSGRTSAVHDPAYVIYTSGSTGRPKGVVIEHRSVAALLAATRDDLRLSEDDVWTCFHSVAFDFSVWEIWGCLATGGRLVMVSEEVTRDPEEFLELLHREQVTVLNQTPSAFGQLLSTERVGAWPLAVRLLIFGGEALDARALLPWFDAHSCEVVNMYGITETTVHSTLTRVTRRDALAGSRAVGWALPGWSIHVLDTHGRPVSPGVAGEIYVSGAGLARGYLGRPGLTAQRFGPDHLSGTPGARLYRSGDRGRWRPDGSLEHLGRLDTQVKIRGYRIELEEIRHRLLEAHGVRAAAVVLRRRGEGRDEHLDAYMVGSEADPKQVRAHLEACLPPYMVPSTITVLGELPLTANGKLDAARLPDPGAVPGAVPKEAPTGLEQRISAIWRDVLGRPVEPDDNFFLVGGNSLLANRVVARMRGVGIGDVRVRMLYQNPTVRLLAGAVDVADAGQPTK